MFHEHHDPGRWFDWDKFFGIRHLRPEPWHRMIGRRQPQPQLHRKQVHGRKTKRQGRQG